MEVGVSEMCVLFIFFFGRIGRGRVGVEERRVEVGIILN